MKQTKDVTKVIFRYWKGDVIAIFPEIPGDMDPLNCLSYQRVGQHGTCDPSHIIKTSKAATESQYHGLKTELESIGYHLKIVSRQGANAVEIRKNEIARA